MAQNFTTKSVIIFDERRAEYKKGQEIRITIPATSVPLLLAKGQTQLRFKVKLESTRGVAACLNNKIGAEALIRELTISTLNGVVLEHIDQYNTLAYIKAHYGRNKTDNNKAQLSRGAGCCKSIQRNPFYSLNETHAGTDLYTFDNYNEVEILLPLDLSGLLGSDNKRIVPLIAMDGGLHIRILLESDASRVVQGVSLLGDGDVNDGGVYNGLLPMGGIPLFAATNSNLTNLPIAQIADLQLLAGTANAKTLHAFDQHPSLRKIAPIFVGSHVQVVDPVIGPTGVAGGRTFGDGGGVVTDCTTIALRPSINLGAALDGGAVVAMAANSRIVLDIDSENVFDYTISNVELICASVQAPGGYLQDLQNKMASGGINYDFKTQTCYNVNQQANTTFNSIYIPATESRALSVISIPRPLEDVHTGPSSAGGAAQDAIYVVKSTNFRNYADGIMPSRCIQKVIQPNNYHYIINNKRIPTRNVDLLRNCHAADRSRLPNAGGNPSLPAAPRFSAVHIKELEDGLSNCGWEIKNLDRPDLAFCVVRNFSRYGHTSDLSNQVGELRLNMTYDHVQIPQIWCNFIVHMRRLVLGTSGVELQI